MEHKEASDAFSRLLEIMDTLREKCPWDRKQTFESLRHLTIEETYELSEAISSGNYSELRKELGDVLLHLVFYAKIASEQNLFTIKDVLDALCEKLIFRHPHVYGNTEAADEEAVKQNWEKIKLKEGNVSVLGGVPSGLPAMIKAMRMQEKARAVGFDWDHKDQVWMKLNEELQEFQHECETGDMQKMEEELGDVLFSVINYARFMGLNPEDALEKTNRKFKFRFEYMEEKVRNSGETFENTSLEQMEVYWNEAKKA
jgi:XTP/dITP diphosphohydrolase